MRHRPSDIAGWPEVQRELLPTALDAGKRRLYDATWREFRREFGLLGGSTRRAVGWAADLRFRQKANLLRVAGTADLVQDLLEGDQQVAISIAFLKTSAAFVSKLAKRRWRVGEINCRQSSEINEATRVVFQGGRLDAIVFTVTESISLHRSEMPGGEKNRALVIHDMRHSAIQLAQIEGRCHRDGERAIVFYAYAQGTVEEAIAATVTRRMASMEAMAGEDTSLLDEIADVITAASSRYSKRRRCPGLEPGRPRQRVRPGKNGGEEAGPNPTDRGLWIGAESMTLAVFDVSTCVHTKNRCHGGVTIGADRDHSSFAISFNV